MQDQKLVNGSVHAQRLAELRRKMLEHSIDAYYVNTADFHQSEYIAEAFRTRAWLTGFSGSAGYALVTADKALLWTDGRYFIQAEKELQGTGFELMKMNTPGYPTIEQWIKENLPSGSLLGMNGEVMSQAHYERWLTELDAEQNPHHEHEPKLTLVTDLHLVEDIWLDRPALPGTDTFVHDLAFTGATIEQKLEQVREMLKTEVADAVLYQRLDDICWLYNFRGHDIPNNPVSLCFTLVTQNKALLFIEQAKLSSAVKEHLAQAQIELRPYFALADVLANELGSLGVKKLITNKQIISCELYHQIPAVVQIINRQDYVQLQKAILNETEQKCLKEAYIADAVALTKFIYWVKQNVAQGELNELNTADYLHELRFLDPYFIEDSFSTISAYGANAAMMHYSASSENYSKLEPKGFYLIDSGGQYYKGTTDITRTISLGKLSKQEKEDYTYTLKSHIALAKAVFLAGTDGYYLDAIARQPLWQQLLDYKCGTGHAVGYVLGVHEGPHRISRAKNFVPLEPGMLVTNEPGVYRENEYGIRLENDLIVVLAGVNADDVFYKFENISFVPFDKDAILPDLLTADELSWLNAYQAKTYELLKDYLSEDEAKWLLQETESL